MNIYFHDHFSFKLSAAECSGYFGIENFYRLRRFSVFTTKTCYRKFIAFSTRYQFAFENFYTWTTFSVFTTTNFPDLRDHVKRFSANGNFTNDKENLKEKNKEILFCHSPLS